jgi:predicted RNase H-like HicB family nuclease
MTNPTLPRFEIQPLTDDEGGGFLIEFPDYPGCIADGESPEEAMREGADALTAYTRTLQQWGARCRTRTRTHSAANGGSEFPGRCMRL